MKIGDIVLVNDNGWTFAKLHDIIEGLAVLLVALPAQHTLVVPLTQVAQIVRIDRVPKAFML